MLRKPVFSSAAAKLSPRVRSGVLKICDVESPSPCSRWDYVVAVAREPRERAFLRRVPLRVAEGLARRHALRLTHRLDAAAAFGVPRRRARHIEIHAF